LHLIKVVFGEEGWKTLEKKGENELAMGKGSSKRELSENPEDRVHWKGDKGWNSGGAKEVLILSN